MTTSTRYDFSAEHKYSYERDGFLILEDFLSPSDCELLINRTHELMTQLGDAHSRPFFSTVNNHHARSQYFLTSGDKIRLFYEENSINEKGQLITAPHLSINKIGHALHDLDPIFNNISRSHKMATLVNKLGIADPLLVQSMVICKQPYIGGEVVCHQDSTFLYVEGQPITGFWFALEDADIENGCLWALPGAHKCLLKARMHRNDHDQIYIETYDESGWPENNMRPLEVSKGSLIVLHGLLPHMSKINLSPRSRLAYTLHIMSGQFSFAADNWLRRNPEMPFQGFTTS